MVDSVARLCGSRSGHPSALSSVGLAKKSLAQVARVLRKQYPRLGDELLGIVDLAQEQDRKGQSLTLVNAAMQQVADKVKDRDFSEAVPENHYRKWTLAALAMGALLLVSVFVIKGATQTSVARWLTPWRLVDRYTFAKIKPLEKEIIVPYAERFDLSTQLTTDTEWKPDEASIRLPGRTRLQTNITETEQYDFQLPPQKEDGSIALRVGDARERIRLKPTTRPELTNLSAKVRLPDYLLYQRDPVIPVRGGTVDLVAGSTVSFIGTASRELLRATINGIPAAISGNSFSTRPEPVEENTTRVFKWNDDLGLTAKSPFELKINTITDHQPDVFAKKLNHEDVVLASEVLSFDINATDDFGLREIGLEWVGVKDPIHNPEPSVGSKLITSGGAEKKDIEARGTFCAERYRIGPQTLHLRAYAEDYFPNRDRVYSPVFVVHIMNPEDHASWLTNEFGKWFNRAREVYEREQQLHETNRELHSLSDNELDRPEVRRKIQRQSAAESSNARRLEALTSNGRDLVRQASKNEEFDAEKLDGWAKMMRALDEISKQKMPSVADLLKKASQAAGAESKSSDEEQQETDPKGGNSDSPPNVNVDHSEKEKSPQKSGEKPENEKPKGSQTPSINDTESTFNKEKPKDGAQESEAGPSSPGRLGMPQTTLKGGTEEQQQQQTQQQSPARENLDQALEEQKDLLQQFAKVAQELQSILSSMETSTFVKRLKAASRRQMDIAKNLNETISNGFGKPKDQLTARLQDVATETAKAEEEESDKVYTIQTDLDAYFQRKQENIYKNVLDQMRATSVVTQLKKIGDSTSKNLNGRSISAAEYWSDTLDRWAEELVAASQSQQGQQGNQNQNKKSLPPEIVLDIMKVTRGEMDLREQTRELEAVRPSLSPSDYQAEARVLELSQTALRTKTDDIVLDILDLENPEQNFGTEIKLLNYCSDVMRQARGILARPNTGPEVIAAQTEVIELLLQSRRQPPQNQPNDDGGGGGSPGGGSAGSSSGGALSDIQVAPGGIAVQPVSSSDRSVDQTTGKTGMEFPEEFRNGLDTYFNELEKIR